ncbi:MAG: peptide-methionine (S)-S-oxide reductase MsrA [Gammaproteobacteria bacterium]|nr:peptide-methionine (S)-S-oxide reductase MsrA [Sideroxydans sp.]MBU3904123.1 peptide-methionine (S)-S-oxide reductase MsrA [Gammaproteobacteria bacterium]MBU4045976.1 peptide-methionine (S)-S-oxide reductase MsrA [Gammaproteobacteria bacterium]MBU4150551.1 peptide-methionine (S)-S-oxide reductase MsrA [Gammaproteobacteria bacterium]
MRYFSILILSMLMNAAAWAEGQLTALPAPLVNASLAVKSAQQTAVFAGGCFWGVELVFQHVKGVVSATSGYAGGTADSARYDAVSRGSTGHAESVQVVYDPSQVSYGQLLKIFFSVAHDPTQLDRQGPDTGPQYRSAIFTTDAGQQRIAQSYIRQLEAARVYPQRIVTRLEALPAFYPAEDYHQDFATRHPLHPYIYYHDRPKLERLKQQFPEWYE